jgi:magnesium transporter
MNDVIQHFEISNQHIQEVSPGKGNWLVLKDTTKEEQEEIIKNYRLPQNIFVGGNHAEEVSRLEPLENTALNNSYALGVTNLSAEKKEQIEERLEPLIFIISDSLLITHVGKESTFIDRLLEKYHEKIHTFAELISYGIYMLYTHYIDELDVAARKTTENDALFKLADTERKIVYLDHTLADQKSTLNGLWENESFIQDLNDSKLVYDIQLHQKHAEKLIHIYRDLLETVGGLFTDMMDNNLNHLMKYLDSAALIISIPALISGIWGMNTGGLPGKGSSIGFFMVVGVAVLLAIIVAVHLNRKDFSK